MPADGLPVIITELAPPARILILAGRDAPKPIRVVGSQRAIQTWYPGSQKASTQVMGTKEEPLVLRGRWDDPLSFIDGGPARRIGLARGIMQGQNLCRLVWGDVIVRLGRISKVDILFQKQARTEYEIVFAVDQPNEAVAIGPLPLLSGIATLVAATALNAAAATALAAGLTDTLQNVGSTA